MKNIKKPRFLPPKKRLFKKDFYKFKDGVGNPCSFRWWRRWTIATWHWRKWLRYEGMPKNIKSVDDMHAWNRKLIEMQDSLNKKPIN